MSQRGTLYQQGDKWSVRWRETVRTRDGKLKNVRRSKVLADVHDFKKSQALDLAREFLDRVAPSSSRDALSIAVTVRDFVSLEYLPHVRASLASSTLMGYEAVWQVYEGYIPEKMRMREARTVDCQRVLYEIHARRPELTKLTLRHIKAFFSGVFTHALRLGVIDRSNPWIGVAIPAGKESEDTYAYSPEEINIILAVTSGTIRSACLVAACAGLRKSEIRGLRWCDWDSDTNTINVKQSTFRLEVKATKSKASKAPVPAIPILAAELNRMKTQRTVDGDERLIFAARAGTPKNLDNLARRYILPALANTSVKWHGFHAFRRGLATFLHSQGVDDKSIQAILRHQNVAVTQAHYVKVVAGDVRKAMEHVTFGQVEETVQ